MKRIIYKHVLDPIPYYPAKRALFYWDSDAQILHVGLDGNDAFCVWASHDKDLYAACREQARDGLHNYEVCVVGTGWEYEDDEQWSHHGTIITYGLVWYVIGRSV